MGPTRQGGGRPQPPARVERGWRRRPGPRSAPPKVPPPPHYKKCPITAARLPRTLAATKPRSRSPEALALKSPEFPSSPSRPATKPARPGRSPPRPTRASASPRPALRTRALGTPHLTLQCRHGERRHRGHGAPPRPAADRPLAPRTGPSPPWTGGLAHPHAVHGPRPGPALSRSATWPVNRPGAVSLGCFAKKPLHFSVINPQSTAFQK